MDTSAQVVQARAGPRGHFAHCKRAGDFPFVSGIGSWRPDHRFVGVEVDEMGVTSLDIRAQTRVVIENLRDILQREGAHLSDFVETQGILANMNDFGAYDEDWAEFFDYIGPTRTTVAVHQLAHMHLLIEIKATAFSSRPA